MHTQTQLEEKIKSYSSDYIYYEAIGSFLLLLLNCVEEEKEKEPSIAYEIQEDILKIKAQISQSILNLEDILNGEKERRLENLEKCLTLKKEWIEIYKSIYRYFAYWNVASLSVSDEIALRKYKEENVKSKNIEFAMFYTDCFEFLNSAENRQQQKYFMAQLFKCAPLKMVRDKYFLLVKKSLLSAFAQESKEAILQALSTFEETCAPENAKDFGKYFPEIAQWLSEKKQLKPQMLSDEELEEEYTDFQSVLNTLTQIEDYFGQTLNDLNSLIILFYLNYTFDDLTQTDISYGDMYHSVCEILTGEVNALEKDAIIDRLHDMLEKSVEPVIDKVNDINKKEFPLLEKIDSFDDLEAETAKILASEGFVRSAYFENISDVLFDFIPPKTETAPSKEWLEKTFSDFALRMKEYFSKQPMQFRKNAMLVLLSSLPLEMTFDELMDYLRLCIEDSTEFEQKVLIVDKAGMVFHDNGFAYRTKEDEEMEHHHHDCGCGHEHHHHEHDCGHEHHHHEHEK